MTTNKGDIMKKLVVGQKVKHPKYGVYTVISMRVTNYGELLYSVTNNGGLNIFNVSHEEIEAGDLEVVS